ncbi:MAG: hypothetical protein ACO1OF_17575 [Adhaeribacter sp.]
MIFKDMHLLMAQAKIFKKEVLLLSFLLLMIAGQALGQTNQVAALQNQFNQYQQQVYQEKLFVHTDKNLYLAGEICWFKLYCVGASGHQPTNLSKVAYLEILDQAQQPVLQTKIALEKGSGHGSLALPATIASGNYLVRAYTNWMKNFSPEFYFEKVITVVNTLQDTEVIAPPAPALAVDIQFFPEGGNLVRGVPTKVGFRAVNTQGQGVPVTGVILDENDQTVAPIQALKFGIGTFTFTPANNKTYRARINLPDNKTLIKELPTVEAHGYGMAVSKTTTGEVQVNVKTYSTTGTEVYLLAHTRQQIKSAQVATLQNNETSFSIDLNKLGEGITHLTLFDKDKNPVAERLYFKRPTQNLSIRAATNKTSYASRQPVKLTLDTQVSGVPVAADLSVSVYRTDSPEATGADFLSYLYLTADLSSSVESPKYYLQQSTPETDAALDNLMLTHGWRRFRWQDVLQAQKPAFTFVPEYEGHIITGNITHKNTGTPVSNLPVYLSVPGKRLQFYSANSTTNGQLHFFTQHFYGNQDIVVQTQAAADSLYRINLSTPFSDKFSERKMAAYSLSDNIWQNLLPQSISMQAQNLFATDKLERFYQPAIDTTAFFGNPFKSYLLDNYTRFPTVEEVLREFVSEVAVRKQSNNYTIKVLDVAKQDYFENSLVLLDGVPILKDTNKFIRYDGRKIQKLEVIPEKYVLGNQTFNGIASFTTYKGNLDGYELNPQALIVNHAGLQLQREFYAPVYETEAQAKSRLPDFRNLLYWSPVVKTNKGETTQLSFYTSDQTGKYIIVVQGLTAQGEAGSTTLTMEVKEAF